MLGLDRLERLDRRWIFAAMGLLVLVPMLFPLYLPLEVSAPVARYAGAIDNLPRGSLVLMSCDYDPSGIPEMVPMTRTTFRHLMARDCKVVVTVLWPGGSGLVDSVLGEVAREFPGKRYGVDWVDLGYRARDYSSFALMVSLSEGYPGTREWVQQVQTRFHLPMVAGVTAVSAPEFYPYLQSGQLLGMLGGMAGAAEYELVRHEKGSATRGMDAQSLAHLFVALCIVLGNLAQWARRKEKRP